MTVGFFLGEGGEFFMKIIINALFAMGSITLYPRLKMEKSFYIPFHFRYRWALKSKRIFGRNLTTDNVVLSENPVREVLVIREIEIQSEILKK